MCPRSCRMDRQVHEHTRVLLPPWWLISLTISTLVVAGCDAEVRNVETRPQTRAPAQTGVNLDVDVENRSAPPAANVRTNQRPPQSGPIIGQRTTEIRNAALELQQGGAKVASTRIVAKDPITLQGNAYVSIVGRTSILNIQHAIDLYKATNDRFPKDYDEFMAEIIRANNIALPQLPPYQAYGYDEKEHKLIVLEYPDKK